MSHYGIGRYIERSCAQQFAYNAKLIFKNYRKNKHD